MLSDDLIVQDVCNDSVEIQCLSTKKCRVKSRSRCQVESSKEDGHCSDSSHYSSHCHIFTNGEIERS